MKEYENPYLSVKHSVAARDMFCYYLQMVLKKPDNMTLNAFKACFKAFFKLFDDLKAYYELTIGEKEKNLLFFNTFSAEHWNNSVQQKKYNKMMMDELVNFFQICHSTGQHVHKQCKCKLLKKENIWRLTKRKKLPAKNVLLLDAKTPQAMILTLFSSLCTRKTFPASTKQIDMMKCGNPAPSIPGTI